MILTHWSKLLDKTVFLDYFNSALESLSQIEAGTKGTSVTALEKVLIMEHCHCIHQMLKEIHYWITRADQLKRGSPKQVPDKLP